MPLFSVVIPAYNRAALLGATLDSVWAQRDFAPDEIEVIVVDDGSTDETAALLESQRARHGARLQTLRIENSGPGAARNCGIAAARGTYVAFLDSDDLWFPWAAATYARVIAEHGEPSLILSSAHEFARDAELARFERAALQAQFFPNYLSASAENLSFGTSCIVARRASLLEVEGFTPRRINAEDLDVMLRLGVAPGFVWLRAPATFAYRRHQASAVSDLARTVAGMKNLLTQERSGDYPGGAARRMARARIISRHLRPVCLRCVREGDARHARALYRATLGWHLQQKNARFLIGAPLQLIFAKLRPHSRRLRAEKSS